MARSAQHRPLPLLPMLCVLIWFSGCGRKAAPPAQVGLEAESQAEVVAVAKVAPYGEGYVDDQRCASCHSEITTDYQTHSMGRSLAALTGDFRLPQADAAEFQADGFHYSVHREGDRWIHRQARLTADGEEMAVIAAEVSHAVGSGHHGQSFLVNRDGYLFLSPLTWYPDKQLWQLSPGYETKNSQFNRPVVEICLYCHANRVAHVSGSLNRYQEPVFRGHSIGCQRCHGPGEAHVQQQESSLSASQSTIVNPAKLAPPLREAVCQQCHLSGFTRVVKPGKSLYDYRPGQPLSSAYTIFTHLSAEKKFVGHVEQMQQSQCFQASDQRLGCISCHDPHRLPAENEKLSFYRSRCLNCHTEQACRLDLRSRREVTSEDSCIVCHMPPQQTEVRHAATTDHSIPRHAAEAAPLAGEEALFAFPTDAVAAPTPRDRAIALVRASHALPHLVDDQQLADARTVLEAASQSVSEDLEATDALAELYLHEGATGQFMEISKRVLQRHPDRELTLTLVAEVYGQLGNHGQALVYWKRAIETNPHMSRYWYQLGRAYANTDQWYLCRQTMQLAKQRFPTSIGVRQLLVEGNYRLGDATAADAEFRELARYRPRGWSALLEWYRGLQTGR